MLTRRGHDSERIYVSGADVVLGSQIIWVINIIRLRVREWMAALGVRERIRESLILLCAWTIRYISGEKY